MSVFRTSSRKNREKVPMMFLLGICPDCPDWEKRAGVQSKSFDKLRTNGLFDRLGAKDSRLIPFVVSLPNRERNQTVQGFL